MIVLWRTLSRTSTAPWLTFVSVPAHVSSTSHFVPRTVAAAYLPSVRNLPLPSPHRLALLGLARGRAGLLPFGHAASVSVSVRVVMPFDCVTLKMPSKNLAVSGGAPAFGIEVSSTVPFRVSTEEPAGMPFVTSRSM